MNLRDLLSTEEWLIDEAGFDNTRLNYHETLFTIGNGYLGTRGSLEEGTRGDLPATYIAGIFDHHDSTVVDLVNAPDWLPLSVWVDGEHLDVQRCKVLEHRRVLDLRQGLLYRLTRFEDSQGRRTRYESLRFASFDDHHICAIRARITPENHSSTIAVEAGIDGERYNLDRLPAYEGSPSFHPEIKWHKWAKSKHLDVVEATFEQDAIYLQMRTLDRDHHLAYASSLEVTTEETRRSKRLDYQEVTAQIEWQAAEGITYDVDKTVAIYTSRDVDRSRIKQVCIDALASARAQGAGSVLDAHLEAWAEKWRDCDIVIDGAPVPQQAVRYNIYQLLIAAAAHDDKVNIGANALTGERYKGHVFWDTEIYLLPFYIYTQPAAARALLLYRYHTLSGALENARMNGYQGAQYAWESADTGIEATPKWTADGTFRLWMSDEEFHITADVAYGILTYVTATDDWDFLADYGAEILVQTSRFWVSRLEDNQAENRLELRRVMGPDEFHEHVDNNAFTNRMAQWHLRKSAEALTWLKIERRSAFERLASRLSFEIEEIDLWLEMADRIYVPQDHTTGVIEQFDGYFGLEEIPIERWDENGMPAYPDGYHHFNCTDTTLIKQPDAVMLLYLLPDQFEDDVKRANYDFYEARTLHKSSLSPAIHSIMGIEVGDRTKAEQYFLRSALVDLTDNQGNTEHGAHSASAGGTWQCAVFGFGGFRVKNGQMTFKPWLPQGWRELRFQLRWRSAPLNVTIRPDSTTFRLDARPGQFEEIVVNGHTHQISSGEDVEISF